MKVKEKYEKGKILAPRGMRNFKIKNLFMLAPSYKYFFFFCVTEKYAAAEFRVFMF